MIVVIFNKPNANFTIFRRSPMRSMAWTRDLKPNGTKTYAKTIRPTPLSIDSDGFERQEQTLVS
jgi:hypothetical protein